MQQTLHRIFENDSRRLDIVPDKSISAVVTSPPYPMISMWDQIFSRMNPEIASLIERGKAERAFEVMHSELDSVWAEIRRVLIPGGFACINIGDAARTFGSKFQMYPNSERITHSFMRLGFEVLPKIIWRKTTNAPNKFMGSGMLPGGAYVTLEHEYILIFRNPGRRDFSNEQQKHLRYESAYFWEERNTWFSDVWVGLNGTDQKTSTTSRERNGAYPIQLPYRIINMFSIKGDTILDPFLGTGTTTMAAIASSRNSIGIEIDNEFATLARSRALSKWKELNEIVGGRIAKHLDYIENAVSRGKKLNYTNANLNMEVMTRQEKQLSFDWIKEVKQVEKDIVALYSSSENRDPRNGELQFGLFSKAGGNDGIKK